MLKKLTPNVLFSISSAILAVVPWIGPNWPTPVKIAICIALLAPVGIHAMLPQDGKGLRLLLFTVWGAILGAGVGFVLAQNYFSESIYEPISLDLPNSSSNSPLQLNSFAPTGRTSLTAVGWIVIGGCTGIGAIIGLYSQYRSHADSASERDVKRRLIFAAIGLVTALGAATAAHGYHYRVLSVDACERSRQLVQEVIDQAAKTQSEPSPSSILMANDAVKSSESSLAFYTSEMYLGLSLTSAAALAAAFYASYVISTNQSQQSVPPSN